MVHMIAEMFAKSKNIFTESKIRFAKSKISFAKSKNILGATPISQQISVKLRVNFVKIRGKIKG